MSDFENQTTNIDLGFVYLDSPTTLQNIGTVLRCENAFNTQEVVSRIKLVLGRISKLKFFLKHDTWVEDFYFDLNNHVEIINTENYTFQPEEPRAANLLGYKTDFEILNEKIKIPFQSERPPWKFYLVNSRSIVATFHHSIIDGQGIVELLKSLVDQADMDNTKFLSAKQIKVSFDKKIQISKHIKFIPSIIKNLFSKNNNLSKALKLEENSSDRRIFFFETNNMRIRELKLKLKATSSEIIFGVIAQALYNNTEHQGEIVAATPVSFRKKNERLLLGNYLSGCDVKLPPVNLSLEEKIKYISLQFKKIGSKIEELEYLRLITLGSLLPSSITKKLYKKKSLTSSVIISSMNFSNNILTLDNSPIRCFIPMAAVLPSHGMAITFTKYRDRFQFGINTDEKFLEKFDVQAFINDVTKLLSLSK